MVTRLSVGIKASIFRLPTPQFIPFICTYANWKTLWQEFIGTTFCQIIFFISYQDVSFVQRQQAADITWLSVTI